MKALELSRDILKREIIIEQTWAKIFALFSFIILTALGAYVRIPLPFTPVPITLQTFFVLLSGAVLGKRWAPASQAGYLLLGLVGLPVFSGAGAGIAYLFGPTGGYIIGFVVSSWIVGKMIHQGNRKDLTRVILAMTIGSLGGIYLFGLLGLCLFLKYSLSQALALGFFPFILGDAIKIISASLVFGKIEERCKEIFSPR
jgi:biotin transport system substrate-specific component